MSSPEMLQRRAQYHPSSPPAAVAARNIYQDMMQEFPSPASLSASRQFLQEQLGLAALLPCDLPREPATLYPWIEQRASKVGEAYADYLSSRKSGEARRYFTCRSHALSFLQQVAPTKLADGAWLYGTLQNWRDRRFHPLIRTYLEELGEGEPAQNHVLMYQRLLADTGCEPVPELSDEHYIQGVLQLALAYHANEFMPEVIGYNLGYEQLPLHLLITAFELNELDIDPYYFSVHVTVDNASCGHARKAVDTIVQNLPVSGDREGFLERLANGYRLNELGLSSTAIIADFDLEKTLVAVLERKRVFGQHMHSDFCRIGKYTVNEWLAKPGRIPAFLAALQERGWITRQEDPCKSRFWKLLEGPKARMFGVFSPYEKQVLYDWIAGDWRKDDPRQPVSESKGQVAPLHKTFPRRHVTISPTAASSSQWSQLKTTETQELTELQQELRELPKEQRMPRLIALMAPPLHATAPGMLATRMFCDVLN